jgi:hypothetical protein
LRVYDAADHHLAVALAFVDQAPRGLEREDCISIALKLDLAQGLGTAYAGGTACYGVRNLYGMDLGGDATTAFEQALNFALQQLEAHRRQLPRTRGSEATTVEM